ncbi:ABC transporter [Hypericibacter adhaerens]|uniref:ABC transporter n=1 Tax=Hypericibacter adhaerens TaxID=2602016 RepID=A0A5J6N6S0_9PROT|nr:ABC transporter permease [Hypericibacter adhaerens]QEX24453.1 ABC transporter [Hypericibacter adhaerens]
MNKIGPASELISERRPAVRRGLHPRVFDLLEAWSGTIILILVMAYFGWVSAAFFSFGNFVGIIEATAITFFISLGVMMSLTVGGFDLSIGSVASMASMLAAGMMVLYQWPYPLAIIGPVLVGAAIGAINGFIIVGIGLPDLLATLGMMFVIGGVQQVYSDGQNIYSHMTLATGEMLPGEISPAFTDLINGDLLGIPLPLLITIVVGGLFYYLMRWTRWGRLFYAVGDNMEAARVAGVPVKRYRIMAYVISGAVAGFGGVLLTALLNAGETQAGASYLLQAVTAVFLGAAFFGRNRVGVFGTLVGAFILAVLVNGLTMINMPYTAQDIFKGCLLVIAVGTGVVIKRHRERSLAARRD